MKNHKFRISGFIGFILGVLSVFGTSYLDTRLSKFYTRGYPRYTGTAYTDRRRVNYNYGQYSSNWQQTAQIWDQIDKNKYNIQDLDERVTNLEHRVDDLECDKED